MREMKRMPFLYIIVVLSLCSTVSTSWLWGKHCSAQMTIYNKLPDTVSVSVDGQSKKISAWGSCIETMDDGSEQIIPCSKLWNMSWESSFGLFPALCSFADYITDENDDNDYDNTEEIEDEEEESCQVYTVSVTVKNIGGMSRSVEVSNLEHEILVINENGIWRVKNPYLDHPDHLRDLYKWFEDAELH
jgi:hypothetical protein